MNANKHKSEIKGNRKRLPLLFPVGIAVLYFVLYVISPDQTLNAVNASGKVLKQMAPPLLLAFVMMFLLNRFITPAHVSRFLGTGAGIKGIVLSSAAGILSMGPIYAWFPLLKTLREKGASDFHLANFLSNRAVKPVLLPLLIAYFGWRFSVILTLLNICGAWLVAATVNHLCRTTRCVSDPRIR